MRNLLIILILAGAAIAAWFLLQNDGGGGSDGSSSAGAAGAALDQIGKNNLAEQELKNLDSFFQDEYDTCVSACKKANCGWFARKCKGKCKEDCLKQQQARYGLTSVYTSSQQSNTNKLYDAFRYGSAGAPIQKPAKVRPYNPILV